jgi:diguanylate cyclase (GGDEF)-like protein/PAS domain S-box-containing protein
MQNMHHAYLLGLWILTSLFVIFHVSVSYLKRTKAERKSFHKEMEDRLLFEQNQDGILILDKAGTIVEINHQAKLITGNTIEELKDRRLDECIHPDDLSAARACFKESFAGNPQEFHVRVFLKDPQEILFKVKTVPLHIDGKADGVYVIIRDIAEQINIEKQLRKQEEEYQHKLKELEFYDSLTQIPNRRLFQDRLLQTIQKAKRNKTDLALFYLDCDRFKWINDTYGHETGDLLLKGFVERVKSCIRGSGTLARLGGDEFAIMLDGFESVQDVARIANQIIKNVRHQWDLNGDQFMITTSIGIAIFPDDGIDMDTLLANAAKALYESKKSGRDTYNFYTREISTKIERIILLEDGLKRAISKRHFHLEYQPQMDIQKNKLAGLEVLLRYTHPKMGMVSPLEFIPICEKIGIIDEVTEWVMKEAFIQQKEWKELGYGEIPISINISPTTLENVSFLQTVQAYLDRFGTNPAAIEFELTEDAFMHNMAYVGKILGSLNQMGIKISLDDFGTGYSSLKYLKDLPINKVKIDRSFIMGIPEKEKEKAIIEMLLNLTERLKGEVICEGVETEEQLSFLLRKGCRLVQGFYFSKPLPKDKLEKLFIKPQFNSFSRAASE